MEHETIGIHRKKEDFGGNNGAIIVPLHICKKIEDALEMCEVEKDLVDERTVLEKFHIKKKTLQNYICDQSIPRSFYTIAFNKTRWYFMSKLLGLKNILTRFHKKPRQIKAA